MDDAIMFGDPSIVKAKIWKDISKNYAKFVGQYINYHKSMLYFFKYEEILKDKIVSIPCYQKDCLPTSYLGLLLTTKNISNTYYNNIVKRVQKIFGWLEMEGFEASW